MYIACFKYIFLFIGTTRTVWAKGREWKSRNPRSCWWKRWSRTIWTKGPCCKLYL